MLKRWREELRTLIIKRFDERLRKFLEWAFGGVAIVAFVRTNDRRINDYGIEMPSWAEVGGIALVRPDGSRVQSIPFAVARILYPGDNLHVVAAFAAGIREPEEPVRRRRRAKVVKG